MRGRVTRAGSDSAVAGAEVMLNTRSVRTEADSAGRFVLRDVTPGAAEITVRRLGLRAGDSAADA